MPERAWNIPTLQLPQKLAPFEEYCPTGQLAQAIDDVAVVEAENVPAVHVKQLDPELWYCPIGHELVQRLAPAAE